MATKARCKERNAQFRLVKDLLRHNIILWPDFECQNRIFSVRVYAVIISKYATKIVGTQKRQVACVHGMQDQKQSTFNTFKPAQ